MPGAQMKKIAEWMSGPHEKAPMHLLKPAKEAIRSGAGLISLLSLLAVGAARPEALAEEWPRTSRIQSFRIVCPEATSKAKGTMSGVQTYP